MSQETANNSDYISFLNEYVRTLCMYDVKDFIKSREQFNLMDNFHRLEEFMESTLVSELINALRPLGSCGFKAKGYDRDMFEQSALGVILAILIAMFFQWTVFNDGQDDFLINELPEQTAVR